MAMTRGKKRPMAPIPCLILAAASCFAKLSESLQVTVQPASIVQKLGGSVSLGCVVDPPRVNLTWRLNGKELPGSDEVLGIHIERGKLIIASLTNRTVGRYQCIARVPEGVIASVPAVVTLANLKDFKFDGQHVIEVDEGNTAVIACDLPESHPKAQVRYSVKQEWLEASRDNYLIMPSGNLQIVNASREDEGTYKCAAYNPVTQEVKTSVSSERLRVRRSTAEAARIIYPLEAQTIIVTKGQSLILECVASGIPPPRVTWAKDGSSVSAYNKTRFLLSNLLIDPTSEEDSGTYSCTADNGVGEAGAAFIFYNVQVFEPPEVTMELSQQIIPWGQSAKFSCEVRGNPQPSVVWLRNAAPLAAGPRLRLSRRALRLLSVGPEDDGIYQCMAENEVGSAQAMARLRTARPGATLNPGRDAQLGSAQPPTPPPRDSALKLPLDKAGLPKPGTTPLAASPQCMATRELVSPAEAPIILSSPRTSKTDSYDLVWRPRPESRAPILYYVVKHRKVPLFRPAPIFPLRPSTGGPVASLHVVTPHEQQVTNASDSWAVRDVPASQHRLTLTRLDPGSLYEVEMAAHNCAGEGQTAMVTFRTGRRPKPEIVASKEQQIQRDDPGTSTQSSNQSDNSRLSPPEAPDRPTISMASETSVYVTWIPRGNGGFPIQSFRVEYKKLKKLGDWVLATSDIPPSRLSVEIPGLEKGVSYKFRVRALNILGESEPSAASRPYVVSGYSNRVYERPVAGPYITFTDAINETTIMLKWMYIPASNNNTPIHGFYIYYRPTDSDNDSDYKKDVVEGDRYWHSISHLQPETSYDIKMQCFNEGGESEFSNVMICETKARKSLGLPGRLPPSTVPPQQQPPLSGGHSGLGAGAMVARSSDLPYLIVGVVLGSIVLLIVAFIPFCLWRAWSKQKQTIDMGFPGAGLLVSSCQYTMVPLRGISAPRASGHPYVSGQPYASGAHLNAICPPAALGFPGSKPRDYSPNQVPPSQEETSALLQARVLQSGTVQRDCQPSRLPNSRTEDSSFLYSLPDDSTHQLLQPQDDCPHFHEHFVGLHHPVRGSKVGGPSLDTRRDPLFHQGSPCCLGLVPVEEVERLDCCQSRGDVQPQNPAIAAVNQDLPKHLNSSPPPLRPSETHCPSS
ncbi:brother of CDO isoform X3 [Colius striatus]|uniref:brother of CDO isoform X3 n=1 Tax=Colius striatus TaxID=57412 RepID=UPI002B1D3975|nr:brother of CDO isoform X3 [Colius striatus]